MISMYTKQVRWEIKPYLFSNNSTKNNWHQTITDEIITEDWVMHFL